MTAGEIESDAIVGLRSFREALVERLQPALDRVRQHPGFAAYLAETIQRELAGVPSSPVAGVELSPWEIKVRELLDRSGEVEECLEALRDSSHYLAAWPEGASDAQRLRHLRYHLGHRLHELNMLRLRLTHLLKRVPRLFPMSRLSDLTARLEREVQASFKGPQDVRRAHVHDARMDAYLVGGIASISFQAFQEVSEETQRARSYLIEATRRSRLAMAQTELASAEALVDAVFADLTPAALAAIDAAHP